jgi:hypothetical protein
MRNPPWKRLVQDLTDQGFESPYLDRLRQKLDVEQAYHDLGREILQEMAAALGRAEDRVNLALLELQLADRQLREFQEQGDVDAFNQGVATYNDRRERAHRRLWELTIHREALGFRRNDILKQYYPIPPRRQPLPD